MVPRANSPPWDLNEQGGGTYGGMSGVSPELMASPEAGNVPPRTRLDLLWTGQTTVTVTRIGADRPYGLLLVGYLLFGVALGLVYAPMSTAAMAAMPAEKVGIASGVLAMDRIVAGSLALAATSAAFHALQGCAHLGRRIRCGCVARRAVCRVRPDRQRLRDPVRPVGAQQVFE